MPDEPALDISVIVPTYNDGQLLERCLASIFRQSLPAMEVIVVDDGSSDAAAVSGLHMALARFPESRLITQSNAGPSAARNRGLVAATGKYVAFVDADDELLIDSLAERRALLRRQPSAMGAYCAVTFVEPGGGQHVSGYRTGFDRLRNNQIGKRNGVPGFLWAYLIETQAIRAVGGLDEGLQIMEDFDLLARLGMAGGAFVGGDVPGYVQHRRPNSLARSSALRQAAGALQFLAVARRKRYFSRMDLLRRYCRVPLAAAKIALRYTERARTVL